MNSDENPIIEYIWQAPAWPDLIWNAALVAPLLEQIAAKAGELRGLRSGLSDADQTMILADELGREAAASYAIEGEIVDPTSISASVAASLNARHRSIVAGGNEPIAELMLDAQTTFSGTPFSLSRTILARRSAYYDALKFSQRLSAIDLESDPHAIDATDFVLWFLEAIDAALDQARGNARLLTTRNRYFEQWRGQLSERQEMVLRRLFEEGQERLDQGISTKPYARIGDVSNVTAARDLADLAKKGAIRKGEAGGRSTRYQIEI